MTIFTPVTAVHYLNKACLLIFLIVCFGTASAKEHSFLVLNYHDILTAEDAQRSLDKMDVGVEHLEQHLDWLKKKGFKIVSVQNVLDAAAGKDSLPDKAALLTFDDGYLSFYTRVFPLLKKYHYPATVALVGTWMDGNVTADEPGKPLLNWAQVREMVQSGLVEVASHSYDLHKGINANPQANSQAAAVTRLYDDPMLVYETDEQYRERIHAALRKSAEFIFQHAGIRPRVMVWPYGEYNQITIQASREAGMPMTMGLLDGTNTIADVSALRRLIMVDNPDVDQFAKIVTGLRVDQSLRVAHLDMDYLYDKDSEQSEHNLDAVIQRIKDMHINTVYLQAYADPDGDGNADALYFPNRHLPVKQDLFSRVAWQLKTKARVRVYAWMPIMAYRGKAPESWYVQEWRDGKTQKASHVYTRLSPFNPEARQYVAEIYEDLAKHCSFDGILFHDDGILSDYEDVSPLALAYAKEVWGLPDQFEQLHATSEMRMAWAQHKTELINQFTDELASRVRIYRPGIKTARNIYALPLLQPYSEEWYAQSFKSFLAHYDYVAIEAMPFMEEAENPDQWLTELVKTAAKQPEGLKKTVFELQSVNWKNQQKVPMPVFNGQLELLKKLGVNHIGYYPDNVFEDQPRLADLQQHFSLPTQP
ncbi:poly-beta-1,6-N-acetyl-D-glucosamine N-deacetylase PgaB [Candidatus Methylobacter oryzae]|uniref:Poly-beta-1,6-N-acetyl-D-glucosamine N-deacetylase PgaB n=1 Tax=Candidatus Methylobacter oryzae TaxID=2497749 RepID=A0ABY3C6J1_9GAMM|nr:poly-beta-1,6-N-acetyl-D-glucosamine N-deacetylase PgaB [Candidatus Methylobacter oryzae]TRW90852.1 poly-beta-1,6-N-acetyl-D-glucosamine N-deacetylase PgaB [Candidatus Methylobacter oryzae]